jgi:hypothetical protein
MRSPRMQGLPLNRQSLELHRQIRSQRTAGKLALSWKGSQARKADR